MRYFRKTVLTIAAILGAVPLLTALPTAAAPSASLANSTVTGPATGVADEISYTVTVTVRDGAGNPLGGDWVTLSSSRGEIDAISPGVGAAADGAGQVQFTVSTITAGTSVYTANLSEFGNIIDTHTIVYSSAVSGANSSVVASPSSVIANGSTNIKLSVTARKSTNAPVSNRTATITSSRGTLDTITPASSVTDGSGVAVFNIHSCDPGTPTLTTTVDGVTLTSPSITFTTDSTPSPGSSELMQSAASAPANNSTTVTITVNVLNSCNRAVSGVNVLLASSRGGIDAISPATAVTNASGSAVFTVRSGTVGSSTYTAQAEAVIVTDQATVTYTAVGAGDATAPSVGSVTPTTGTVGVAQTYSASVSDNVGISECSFFVDGVSQSTSVGGGLAQHTHTFSAAGLHSLYVSCADAAGNIGTGLVTTVTVSAGGGGDFTPPNITGITVTGITTNQAVISWTTDEGSTTHVDYGLSASYGAASHNAIPVTSHSATIIGLGGGTVYHYRVESADAAGNATRSGDLTFTTLAGGPGDRLPTGTLVKLTCPASPGVNHPCREVSYIGSDGKRYSFPHFSVFLTWYPSGFSSVVIREVSPTELATYPRGRNITHRPGYKLVKSPVDPKVYAVTKGDSTAGVFRALGSTEVAAALYGAGWATQVLDFAEVFFAGSVRVGAPINIVADYNPAGELGMNATVDQSMGR